MGETYRKSIIAALLALIWVTGRGQTMNWRIEGVVANAAPSDTLMVIDAEKQSLVTTLQVKDGHIVPVSGMLDGPAVCCIAKQGRPGWIREFVLENGTVNLDVDLNLHYLIQVSGTPVNDELMAKHAVQHMNTDFSTYAKNMYEVVSRLVSSHPSHPISPYLIGQCQLIFTPSELLGLIDRLSPDQQSSLKIERLKESLLLAQETEEGKMFKQLTGVSPEGQPVALSDFVGRGSYVLADFWASWCRPCLEEMPHVVSLYEKYKDKGLKVVGITVSDTPEKSDSIVQKLGIPFPLIYESKPMSIYGVTAIPHYILFAPDGTILSRRMRSRKELDRKLAEVLNGK